MKHPGDDRRRLRLTAGTCGAAVFSFLIGALFLLPLGVRPLTRYLSLAEGRASSALRPANALLDPTVPDLVRTAIIYVGPIALGLTILCVAVWLGARSCSVRPWHACVVLFLVTGAGVFGVRNGPWVPMLISVYCTLGASFLILDRLLGNRIRMTVKEARGLVRDTLLFSLGWVLFLAVPWAGSGPAPLQLALSFRDLCSSPPWFWLSPIAETYYYFCPLLDAAFRAAKMGWIGLPGFSPGHPIVLEWGALTGVVIIGVVGPPLACALAVGAARSVSRTGWLWGGGLSLVLLGGCVLPGVVSVAVACGTLVVGGLPDDGQAGALRSYYGSRALAEASPRSLNPDQAEALKALSLDAHGFGTRYWATRACARQQVPGWEEILGVVARTDPSPVIQACAIRALAGRMPEIEQFHAEARRNPDTHPYVLFVLPPPATSSAGSAE